MNLGVRNQNLTTASSHERLYFLGPAVDGAEKTGTFMWGTSKPAPYVEEASTLGIGEGVRKKPFKYSSSAPLKLQD